MSKKTPAQPKSKAIEIISVKRTRRTIEIEYNQGDAKFSLSERDNPLPSFSKAMDQLNPIVGTICHFPADYGIIGMRVVGFKLGQQAGADTVALQARKDIDDASKEFVIKTPERLLSHPKVEGKYTPPLNNEQVALIREAEEQAKAYVRGDRAQGQIAFEGDEEDPDAESGNELAFPAAGSGKAVGSK